MAFWLRRALAACRAGDALVVTKLDRWPAPSADARTIVDQLTRPQIGGEGDDGSNERAGSERFSVNWCQSAVRALIRQSSILR